MLLFVAKRNLYCPRYTYIYVRKHEEKLREAVKSISFVQLRQRRVGRCFSENRASKIEIKGKIPSINPSKITRKKCKHIYDN